MKNKNKKGRNLPPFNLSKSDIRWDIARARDLIQEVDNKIIFFKTEKMAYKQAIKDLKKLLK